MENNVIQFRVNELKKAINNINKRGMQHIYISTDDGGMGGALASGDYIDLSNNIIVGNMVKEALIKMLEENQLLLEIANHDN